MGAPPVPGRRPWGAIGLLAAAVLALVAFAVVAAVEDPGRPSARDLAGATDRASFLLVPAGRSRAEVRDLLGPPRRTRVRAREPAGSECWLYAARSGRAISYELCFRGDFLTDKSILPSAP